MTTDSSYGKLVKLGDVGQTVADKDKDIRGRHVVDKNGVKLGKVDALLVDDKEHRVRFLEVETGGFLGIGERKSLIPIDAISSITDHEVHIDQTGSTVASAPAYDPALVNDSPDGPAVVDDSFWGETYHHYGYTPYWGLGYAYPGFPHFAVAGLV
jgi:sporulation protein YlmC with PRC-barrel domain